jgi:hypothetical protein
LPPYFRPIGAPGTDSSGDVTSHLLVLQQLHVQITLATAQMHRDDGLTQFSIGEGKSD